MILSSNDANLDWLIGASELPAMQNIGDLETRWKSYLSRVFPTMDEIRWPDTWPKPDEIQKFGKRLAKHKRYDIPYKRRNGPTYFTLD